MRKVTETTINNTNRALSFSYPKTNIVPDRDTEVIVVEYGKHCLLYDNSGVCMCLGCPRIGYKLLILHFLTLSTGVASLASRYSFRIGDYGFCNRTLLSIPDRILSIVCPLLRYLVSRQSFCSLPAELFGFSSRIFHWSASSGLPCRVRPDISIK